MEKYRVFYRREGDPITMTKKYDVSAVNAEDAKRVVVLVFKKNGVNIHIMSAANISERADYKRGQALSREMSLVRDEYTRINDKVMDAMVKGRK